MGGSRAWAKFKAMPFVQQAWAIYTIQAAAPGNPVNTLETALADPKVREALAFLKEIASDEVFVSPIAVRSISSTCISGCLGSFATGR